MKHWLKAYGLNILNILISICDVIPNPWTTKAKTWINTARSALLDYLKQNKEK